MKNKVREQLRMLAQQIIKEEKTFHTSRIKSRVSDLYNQLVVLEYLEKQIGEAPEEALEESLDSKSFREENWFTEPEPVPQPAHEEDLVEPLMEKIKDLVAQMPEESGKIDDLINSMMSNEKGLSEEDKKDQEREDRQEQERKHREEQERKEKEEQERLEREEQKRRENEEQERLEREEQERREKEEQERLEREEQERLEREEQERRENEEQERLEREEQERKEKEERERKEKQDEERGRSNNSMNTPAPTRNELEEFASAYQRMPEFERKNPELFPPSTGTIPASKKVSESKPRSINDTIKRGLNVGLNDRLAFVKHLFEGHTEDYTRVLSQINTMSSFEEAERFITENVKPDYHNWDNKEVYSERFMKIIEKRFN